MSAHVSRVFSSSAQRKHTKTLRLGIAALAAAAGVGLALRFRGPARMPHLNHWRKVLARTHGPAAAERLALCMQARYDALRAERPSPRSVALRIHLHQMILPGLALYQALRNECVARDAALAEVQSVLSSSPSLLGPTVALVRRARDPYRALRWINRASLAIGYPSDGWEKAMVADTEDTYAFDISRCYYQDTFAAHDAPELTALYCQLDDLAFERLPASVRWERTTTLGCGGTRCDFRWSRAERDAASADRRDASSWVTTAQ